MNEAAFVVGGLKALDGIFEQPERPAGLAGKGVAATGDATDPTGGVEVVVPAAGVFLHAGEGFDERLIVECANSIGQFGAVAGALYADANEVEIAGIGAARVVCQHDGSELLELGGEAFAEPFLSVVEAALESLAETTDAADEAKRGQSVGVARRGSEDTISLPCEHTFKLGETAGVEAGGRLGKRHLEHVEVADLAEAIPQGAQAASRDFDLTAIEPRTHHNEGFVQAARRDTRGVDCVDVTRGPSGFELVVQSVEPVLGVGDQTVRERCVLGL